MSITEDWYAEWDADLEEIIGNSSDSASISELNIDIPDSNSHSPFSLQLHVTSYPKILVVEKDKLSSQAIQNPKSSVNAIKVSKEREPIDWELSRQIEEKLVWGNYSDWDSDQESLEVDGKNENIQGYELLPPPKDKTERLYHSVQNSAINHLTIVEQVLEIDGSVDQNYYKSAPKCKDKGTITIPCIIDEEPISNCMLDNGAAINVIPFCIYSNMFTKELVCSDIVVNLANISSAKPVGKLVDVVVYVGKLRFRADFYIMHTEEDGGEPTVILGRPFMRTARAKIDVFTGAVSLEADERVEHIEGYKPLSQHNGTTERLDHLVQNTILNHLAVAGQVEKKSVETPKTPPRRRKKKRNKKKKCVVMSSMDKSTVGEAEHEIKTAVKKFNLDQPWDPNL